MELIARLLISFIFTFIACLMCFRIGEQVGFLKGWKVHKLLSDPVIEFLELLLRIKGEKKKDPADWWKEQRQKDEPTE